MKIVVSRFLFGIGNKSESEDMQVSSKRAMKSLRWVGLGPWGWFVTRFFAHTDPSPKSQFRLTTAFIATAIASSNGVAQVANFERLGGWPGVPTNSRAVAVTSDGETVAGYAATATGDLPFRWTSQTGMTGLGDLPAGYDQSLVGGISDDGNTVVGWVVTPGHSLFTAYRWTPQVGYQLLGDPGDSLYPTFGIAVSADGTVIAGNADCDGATCGFRWDAIAGLQDIGDIEGGDTRTNVFGISADGLTIIGRSLSSTSEEAFRWTSETGMASIVDPAANILSSVATCASREGTVVAGWAIAGLGSDAFRWTAESGMEFLGDLPGGLDSSTAQSISGDGEIIGGSSSVDAGAAAFIWNRYHGMRSLAAILRNAFHLDLTGWDLVNVTDISDDGRVFVGTGLNPNREPESWRVSLPRPCSADVTRDYRVDIDDLTRLLAHFGTLSGAVHRDGDVNLDGAVEISDLAVLLAQFGTICQ